MSVRVRFSTLAAMNGGNLLKFRQSHGLAQVGTDSSSGVCQAFCFFDGLLALAGCDPERTKRKDVVEHSVHFQKDFSTLSRVGLTMWDPRLIRAKYNECLGYIEMQKFVRVGYVVSITNEDELIGFLMAKQGYFNLLQPSHVTGYMQGHGTYRYFDPNAGIASFGDQRNALNFISDLHSCDEFRKAYHMSDGDLIVVQLVNT